MIAIPIVLSVLVYIVVGLMVGAYIHGRFAIKSVGNRLVGPESILGGIFWPITAVGALAACVGRPLESLVLKVVELGDSHR